jgi:hypothetical protein
MWTIIPALLNLLSAIVLTWVAAAPLLAQTGTSLALAATQTPPAANSGTGVGRQVL